MESEGSLSLCEELDDIQLSIDRYYTSPAPNHFSDQPRQTEPACIIADPEGFDKLSLLELEELSDVNNDTDWLCDVKGEVPDNFSEEDRSFLDTGLLNIRYSLLNYVTRAITEFKMDKGEEKIEEEEVKESDEDKKVSVINPVPQPTIVDDEYLLKNFRPKYSGSTSGDQFNSYAGPGPSSREIDSRTYTRQKKSRFTLTSSCRHPVDRTADLPLGDFGASGDAAVTRVGQNLANLTIDLPVPSPPQQNGLSPQRVLNATMSLSPDRSPRHWHSGSPQRLNTTNNVSPNDASRSPQHLLNRTIDISPERSGVRGSPLRLLNTTIDMTSPERRSSLGATGISSPPANLNETFTAENGESSSEKSRRVTRNLSYVIRRDEESPNNNSSSSVSANTSRCDLNNTFSYDQDAERDVNVTRSSQNTSMEDLNSRVASQIRSLGCSTITRGTRYSDQGGRAIPNLDDTRLVARTSSTDTYSVAQSSESPTSSGLSSPMDAQSYDDIQSSSEAVRRSMPNLAVIRNATTMRSNLAFPQAGAGQLRKNHYISDSRLSRLGNGDNRPRLRVHGSESNSSASSFNQGLNSTDSSTRSRASGSNTSTPAALNRISSGVTSGTGAGRVYSAHALGSSNNSRPSTTATRPTQGSSMGNVRSTGMPAPRYTGGLRPPRPIVTSGTNSQQPRSSMIPGIPVASIRTQSRIPAPGQFRFGRPSQVNASNRLMGNSTKGSNTSHQKGPVADDWRDGCY